MLMKDLKDLIRNRTHDLPACSAMPQPTALLRNRIFYAVLVADFSLNSLQINGPIKLTQCSFLHDTGMLKIIK
jgi:hypothetical protein